MAFEAFLAHEFATRRGRNARYSLRSFARDLRCDHASLSQWLRGKRKLTPAGETRLARALKLDRAALARARAFETFDLALVAALDGLKRPTTRTLAARLGATTDDVNIALNRLMRLGLLRMEGTTWKRT
ncbi:MAG TPA: hypothetical protein VG889_02565 [Rhizomicrobium sp.]|nr:hypothetical protein [Rhizomicrobium sp.]